MIKLVIRNIGMLMHLASFAIHHPAVWNMSDFILIPLPTSSLDSVPIKHFLTAFQIDHCGSAFLILIVIISI